MTGKMATPPVVSRPTKKKLEPTKALAINLNAGLLFIDFHGGGPFSSRATHRSTGIQSERATIAGAKRIVDFEVADLVANENGFPLIAKFRQYSRFNPA